MKWLISIVRPHAALGGQQNTLRVVRQAGSSSPRRAGSEKAT